MGRPWLFIDSDGSPAHDASRRYYERVAGYYCDRAAVKARPEISFWVEKVGRKARA